VPRLADLAVPMISPADRDEGVAALGQRVGDDMLELADHPL
jgi:hypothetical protein